MNFVCLSPHFPPNYRNFWLRLQELGVNVLGIADVPYEELGAAIQKTLGEYYRVNDMTSYDDLVRAMGFLTHKHGKIDRLESHNEYWLETEAALRTDFNIPGPKRDTIGRVKRKSLMKQVFRHAGVHVARGRIVTSPREAAGLAEDLGYPLVVKPDIGVGAVGTARINDREDLVRFFDNKPPADYMMEEFVDGSLCSFDGLTGPDGQIVFCTSHVFNQGILEIVQNNDDMYYYSVRELDPDLEQAGRQTVAAFELRDRFFHIEFFRRHVDGRIIAVEVNMRPPGGLTTDMFNFANEIDVYREYASIVATGEFKASWTRPYHCMYIGRKDHITYRHSHEDVLREGGALIVQHERVQSAFARAIGDQAYIARHADLEPLQALTRYTLEA